VFGLTNDRAFAGQGDVANQIQRAALSVSNNVAEGFERGSTNELIAFSILRARVGGEVRSILCLLERNGAVWAFEIRDFRFEIDGRVLFTAVAAVADHLQNTPDSWAAGI